MERRGHANTYAFYWASKVTVSFTVLYTHHTFHVCWLGPSLERSGWYLGCVHVFWPFQLRFLQDLSPSCALWRQAAAVGDSVSGQPQLFFFLILIDLDLFLCFAVMKKWEVPRDCKILSASPRSNSHTPKLGPLYKIYCLKLSRNKKFKRPGCFNALQWIIKKCAIPDNGEGNFNTFGCKFTEETLWHIFVLRSYMTLSCILISVSKEMVKYSSGVSHPESGLMLNTENERHHFLKNRNLYKWDIALIWAPCSNTTASRSRRSDVFTVILGSTHQSKRCLTGSCHQYETIDSLHYEQGHSVKTRRIKHWNRENQSL